MIDVITWEVKANKANEVGVDVISDSLLVNNYEAYTKLKALINDLREDSLGGRKGSVSANLSLYVEKFTFNNPDNLTVFIKTYKTCLNTLMELYPNDYMKDYVTTANNMHYAIIKGTFNKDSQAFKDTCKSLGIKHTYKAIDEYIGRVK